MRIVAALVGVVLVAVVWRDAFETIILPRRVTGVRFSKVFYRLSWKPWAAIARRMPLGDRRESYLSVYGPLSLLILIVLWGIVLIGGFALMLWAANFDSSLSAFGNLYVSGTSFTTLGIGDFVPRTDLARFVTVVEAGTGFGFLAVVISYLPILYQGFSRRETAISMLDEWAGSPPSAGDLFRRAVQAGVVDFATFRERLTQLRKGYEPYSYALAQELLMELPPWLPMDGRKDNWETTAWEGSAPGESLR